MQNEPPEMFSTTITFAIGMKFLLFLMLLCDVNISRAVYIGKYTDEDSSEEVKNQLTRSAFSKYPIHRDSNSRYRLNRRFYGDAYAKQHNLRFLHPHWFSYFYKARNSNPSKAVDNSKFSSYKRSVKRSSILNRQVKENVPFLSQKLTNGGDVSKSTMRESRFKQTSKRREADDPSRSIFSDSRKLDSRLKSDGENAQLNEKSTNDSSIPLESGLKQKDTKRDLPIAKQHGSSRTKRLFQSLRRFDLLYFLGLSLIFIPLASIAVVVVAMVSFCWNSIRGKKRRKAKKDSDNNSSPGEVAVETAIVKVPAENKNLESESKSYTDLYKNFVANEIDGDGDTVGKRMKLENWMNQGYESLRQKTRLKDIRRHIAKADMESVAEERSEGESNADYNRMSQGDDSETEYESLNKGRPEDASKSPPARKLPRKKRSGKVSKQESRPFNFPDKMVTANRVHDLRYPRYIHSLVEPRRGRRATYSMVDINLH